MQDVTPPQCPVLQMEPVPKAVLGAALTKPRRPVIACSICQIRFNSEVRPPLTPPLPNSWDPPIYTHTMGPAPLCGVRRPRAGFASQLGFRMPRPTAVGCPMSPLWVSPLWVSPQCPTSGQPVSPGWESLGCSVSPGCPQSGGSGGVPCHKSIPRLQRGHPWAIPCRWGGGPLAALSPASRGPAVSHTPLGGSRRHRGPKMTHVPKGGDGGVVLCAPPGGGCGADPMSPEPGGGTLPGEPARTAPEGLGGRPRSSWGGLGGQPGPPCTHPQPYGGDA